MFFPILIFPLKVAESAHDQSQLIAIFYLMYSMRYETFSTDHKVLWRKSSIPGLLSLLN